MVREVEKNSKIKDESKHEMGREALMGERHDDLQVNIEVEIFHIFPAFPILPIKSVNYKTICDSFRDPVIHLFI